MKETSEAQGRHRGPEVTEEPIATRTFKRAIIRQLVPHAGFQKRTLARKARGGAVQSRPAKRHRGPGRRPFPGEVS